MSVICDLDNTLVTKGVVPKPNMIQLVNNMPDVYIVTGRVEAERARTTQLLHQLGIKFAGLMMNSIGPDAASQMHSKAIAARQLLAKGPVTMAIDDDGPTRIMYQKLGISNVTGPR